MVPATIGCFPSLRQCLSFSSTNTFSDHGTIQSSSDSGADGHLIELVCWARRQHALLARSRVAEGRTRLCLDRPDRPIFQHTREPILDPRKRTTNHREDGQRSAAGEAAEALQFPRLDRVFRNISLGGPTALLISVMPSKIRPSGQAAKLSLDRNLDPTLAAGLSHHSRASKLVALKTWIFHVYLRHSAQPAFSLPSIPSHLHASPKPLPALVLKTPNGTAYSHRLQHTF